MKIRSKLILWFGSVTLLVLLAYTILVYISLAESIGQNQDEKFGEQVLTAMLLTERHLDEIIHRVDTVSVSIVANPGIHPEEARAILGKARVATPMLRGTAIIANDRLLAAEGETPEPGKLQSLSDHLVQPGTEANAFTFIPINDNLMYLGKRERCLDGSPYTLFIAIDRKELNKLLKEDLLFENGRMLVFSGREKSADLIRSEKDLAGLKALTGDVQLLDQGRSGHFVAVGDWFIFRPDRQLYGLDLVYLLPADFHLADLIKLKNRVIAATIVLAWISVWVVLILAYRISTPLVKLARVTNDMITFNYRTPFDFSPSNDEIGILARSIDTMRQRIEELVIRDPLTRTYNRRYLMYDLSKSFAKGIRLGEDLCCVMVDIDYFKKINDTYGHQAGDEVLREVAEILRANTRDYDTVARYGGEEFTVLLPQTDKAAACMIVERLRAAVEERLMPHGIRCTISLGVAFLASERHASAEALLEDADSALYVAKEAGRNRMVVFETPAPESTPAKES